MNMLVGARCQSGLSILETAEMLLSPMYTCPFLVLVLLVY